MDGAGILILNEVAQTQKDEHRMLLHMWLFALSI